MDMPIIDRGGEHRQQHEDAESPECAGESWSMLYADPRPIDRQPRTARGFDRQRGE